MIEGGRIAAIERGPAGSSAPGTQVIDLGGKTVLPGLWDAHAHFYDWMGELFLANGVTTIVDVGNYPDWILAQRDGVAKGKIRAPRILACGNALGGDPVFAAQRHMSLVLDGAEDARAKARMLLDRGVDGLKLWVFSEVDEIRAAAEEVRRAGRTAAIGHISVSATEAADAGLTTLAHATGLPAATVKDPLLSQKLTEAERHRMRALFTQEPAERSATLHLAMEEDTFPRVVDDLIAHGLFIEPDLVFKWMFALAERSDRYDAEDLATVERSDLAYVPDWARARLRVAWGDRRRLTPERRDELKRAFGKVCTFLRLFAAAGGRFLTGSDTTTWPLPGAAIGREMAIMHEVLGLSPLEAISCATRYPAESMGRGADLGTLERGKIADLIAVEADPLEDLEAVRRVSLVVCGGTVVDHTCHVNYVNPIPKPRIGLTHSNPIPAIRAILPSTAQQMAGPLTIGITGAGFIPGSVAWFAGQPVATRLRSPQGIEAEVPAALLRNVGTLPVWVENPLPVRITDYLHQDGRSNVAEFVVGFA